MKEKNTAALMALFGGVFGVHKFYLNEAPSGVFYVFLFLMTRSFFPVSLLLGVVDAIRLFSMSTQEFDAKYNKRALQRRGRQQSRRGIKQNEKNWDQAQANRKKRSSRKPKSNPFKKSGIKKYNEYDMEGAIEDLNKALLVDENDIDIYYTLACAYSLMEKPDEAYKNLELAVMKGFKNFEKIQTEDNLAFLRIHEDFDEFKKSGFKSKKIYKLKQGQPKENLLDDDVLLSQLNKLAELRKKGLLSEKEFEYERKKLMRR